MNKKNQIILAAMVTSLFSFGTIAAEETKTAKNTAASEAQIPANLPTVSIEKVTTLNKEDYKKCVGIIRSIENVSIPARVSGILEKIDFKEGSMVKKGDLLFEIEDDIYLANLQSAEANLKQIKAEYDYAKSEYERYTQLKEKSITSQADYENAMRQYRSTEAQIAAAEAAVAIAKIDVSYTKIYSPLSGRISEKSFSIGNYVSPNSNALADIVQYDPIRVSFSLKVDDFFKYINGQNLMEDSELILDFGNGVYKTSGIEFDFIANQIDRRTATLMIHLKCENKENLLIPGGFVTIKLAKKYKEPIPAIAITAIMTDNRGSYVYVLDDQNIASRRDVKLGKQVGPKQTIESGLIAGERVIVEGVHKARINQPVNPVFSQGLGE